MLWKSTENWGDYNIDGCNDDMFAVNNITEIVRYGLSGQTQGLKISNVFYQHDKQVQRKIPCTVEIFSAMLHATLRRLRPIWIFHESHFHAVNISVSQV